MSKLALALKYRPKSFDDLTEQENVKKILEYQLANNENKNCYLFCGVAGTGKTTSARIFGNMLNQGIENLTELDAASNNGVDDVRKIIELANTKDLISKFKVFVLDECFKSDTLITMNDNSVKQIKDVCIGDKVRNMSGVGTITNVFKNSVFTNRLCCVKINGIETFTTKDHLYFTNNGWIETSKLKKGDLIYDTTYLRRMWKRVFNATKESEILLFSMFSENNEDGGESKIRTELCETFLSNLWKRIICKEIRQEKDLLNYLQEQINKYNGDNTFPNGVRKIAERTIIEAYEKEKSIAQSRDYSKSKRNEIKKWYVEYMVGSSWWEWAVYETSTSFMGSTKQGSSFRICNTNENDTRDRLPYLLQSRPCLYREEIGDRGGWEKSPFEKLYAIGQKENNLINFNGVESVEIYERGNPAECFTNSFSDKLLSQEFIDLYDLEVSNHSSYFANGCLVHNCHMLSTAAFNALLKLLEEPPLSSVFILCTTDPQKIPKTVLSRVQRFDFKRISNSGIVNRLEYIISNENQGITYDKDALEYISRLADGGMRDAITLLDKVLDYSKELNIDNVTKALDISSNGVLFNLTLDLINNNKESIITATEKLYNDGNDIKLFTKQFLIFILNLSKYVITKDITLTNLPPMLVDIMKTNNIEYQKLVPLLEMIVTLDEKIKWETSPKTLFQTTLLLYRGE